MAPRIADLAELDPADPSFGGKAAGLARLLAAGVRVPSGFAVAADGSGPWPEPEQRLVLERARPLLELGPVAVRSSARGEDGAERSFAGLFETVLDVVSDGDLLAAVDRCLASGASERVRAYAGDAALPVGLVIQRQVDARAAGVCFTRDPSGRDGAVLIEAVLGTGDALVSGRVQPERWRVYRSGRGALEGYRDCAGAGPPALAEATAEWIAAEALALSAALGQPLDLEWAVDRAAQLCWLQARPITAAADPPPALHVERAGAGAADGPVTIWCNVNLRETLPDPLSPLSWSLWRDRFIPALTGLDVGDTSAEGVPEHAAVVDLVEGRVYANLNAMLAVPVLGQLLEGMLSSVDAGAVRAFAELDRRGVLEPRRLRGRSRRALRCAALRAQWQGFPALVKALRPQARLREFEAIGAELIRRREAPLAGRGADELIDEVRELTSPDTLHVAQMLWSIVLAMGTFVLARRVFRDHPAAERLLAVGIANNPTTGISLAIEDLTAAAAPVAREILATHPTAELLERLAEQPDGRAFLESLARFLEWNGHRCPKEFDVAEPRWIEDPTMILDLIRAGLAQPPKEGVRARLERLGAERRRAVAEAVATAPAWKRPLLRLAARAVERHLPLREAGKHYLLMAFPRLRALLFELGSRLAASGALETREDVFFLDLRELDAIAHGRRGTEDLRAVVCERRDRFARFGGSAPPPFLRSDGIPVPAGAAPATEDGVLCGVGVGTGRASGPVRVLHAPDPSLVEEGDVLVVRFADPGWTPLFPRAAALVMEVGGLMCHAAVVARELGIPAVFGVAGATTTLPPGHLVEVDADLGTVTVR